MLLFGKISNVFIFSVGSLFFLAALGKAIRAGFLGDYMLLLLIVSLSSLLIMSLPGGSMYGLALMLIYVGGIAILAFFCLIIYGKWYYQLRQISPGLGEIAVSFVLDWEIILLAAYSFSAWEGSLYCFELTSELVSFHWGITSNFFKQTGLDFLFDTYSGLIVQEFLVQSDWFVLRGPSLTLVAHRSQSAMAFMSYVFSSYGGLYIELLALLLLFVLVNAVLIFLGAVSLLTPVHYFKPCKSVVKITTN